jgi:O-antigen/teichoic acid export membrane protein
MQLKLPYISSFSHSSKAFLKDSTLLFISNILNAALNYGLIIFVSNKLLPGNYSLWTAITGLVAILLTFSAGIMTEFNKTASKIAKESVHEAFRFYHYFLSRILRVLLIGAILIPVFSFVLMNTLGNGNFVLLALVVLNVYVQIVLSLNNNFVMALLEINKFIVLAVVGTVVRFVVTIALIYAQFEVTALPVGLLITEFVGLALGMYYLRGIKAKDTSTQLKKPIIYNMWDHMVGMLKTVVFLFFLSLFLNVGPIIAEKFLLKADKDILAVLFNFGQIIHFGAVAFLGGLIAHASRNENKKIFYAAFVVVTGLSLFIGFLFTFFGGFMMKLFGRAQYIDQLPLILWYSVFILFYNIIFLCTQYLIIQNRYKTLIFLPIANIVFILALIFLTKTSLFFGDDVKNFISICIVFGFITALFLGLSVLFDKKTRQTISSVL